MSGHHHHHHHEIEGHPGEERYRITKRVTLVGAAVDLLLGVSKILVGWIANSQALIADGVHSLSDLGTDFFVLFAAKQTAKGADEDHPYGHERIETLATVALGLALIGVGFGIAWEAGERLFDPESLKTPGALALVVAVISVVSKEAIYHYTMHYAKQLRSKMLKANAWHSRTDAISSLVVIVGVAGAMAGLTYLDAVAAVIVAVMVGRVGWGLAWQGTAELVDTGLSEDRVDSIRQIITGIDGVVAMHSLRTRSMGGNALVDVHIQVAPDISVSEGHQIAETVRWRLMKQIDEVDDALVHIDPEDDDVVQPAKGLPLRGKFQQLLDEKCAGLEAVDHVDRTVIHYLDGAIEVELFLKPSHDALPAGALVRLRDTISSLEMVRRVRLFSELD